MKRTTNIYLRLTMLMALLMCVLMPFGEPLCVAMAQESSTESGNENNLQEAEPDRLAEDFVQVGLLISDPGNVLYSILGHACLHLKCPYYDLDYVFSYESESVKGRVFRFLLNDLKMGMVALSLDDYLEPYKREGRGVREYPLHLPSEVKSELWRVLDEKLTEGMELQYDYIKRGCAISVVHCLDEAIEYAGTDIQLNYPVFDERFDRTLREIVYDNSSIGWQRFFAMTLVGGQVDNPDLPKKEKLIIPRELVSVWQQTTCNGIPLIATDLKTGEAQFEQLLPSVTPYKGDKFTPLHLSLILLVISIGMLGMNRFNRIFCTFWCYLILGLQTALGCLMLWLLLSPLPGSEWSWLIVVFNPLPAICWYWRRYWGVWYLVIVVLWCAGMLLAPHRLVEYAHLLLAIAFAITATKQLNRRQAVCEPK